MSFVKVPEYILLDTVRLILRFIKSDYDNQSDKTQSVLYQLIGDLSVDKYSYWSQAVQIFITNQTGPTEINVNLIYNMQVNDVPSIYVSLPSETGGPNSIGNNEGEMCPVYNDITGSYQIVYTRRYQTNYQYVITSNNSNEVVIIYHVLRAFLISLTQQLEFLGLKNLQITGNDISMGDITPSNIYLRAINLNFFYATSSLDLSKYPIIREIVAIGTPKVPEPVICSGYGEPLGINHL